MAANGRVDLLIPGLSGPIPVVPENLPSLPALARVLGRANRHQSAGIDTIRAVFQCFGFDLVPDLDPPSAAFSHLADCPDTQADGFLIHADPVHLRPDRDRLLLFDARHIELEQPEADALVALFNAHFEEDGLALSAPSSTRWYLRLRRPPQIRTRPLAEVVGREIERAYIRGKEGKQWMQRLNEVQMLFYHSDVNQRRGLAGRPAVSSIWPWGGGSLPATMPQCRYGTVLAEHPLAIGLGRATGTATQPLPDNPREIVGSGLSEPALVLWDKLWPAVLDADANAWPRELTRLEDWIKELVDGLKAGKIAQIDLLPCDGTRMSVTRGALRRFWRRPMDISTLLRPKSNASTLST